MNYILAWCLAHLYQSDLISWVLLTGLDRSVDCISCWRRWKAPLRNSWIIFVWFRWFNRITWRILNCLNQENRIKPIWITWIRWIIWINFIASWYIGLPESLESKSDVWKICDWITWINWIVDSAYKITAWIAWIAWIIQIIVWHRNIALESSELSE